MAITIKSDNPAILLEKIKRKIDEKSIKTWTYDDDGDFKQITISGQFIDRAWLRPRISVGELRFGLLGVENTKMTTTIYGIYHGGFVEMLTTHFSINFSSITVSARKSGLDTFEY